MRNIPTRSRLRNRRTFHAVLSAVGAVTGIGLAHTAVGQTITSDTTYAYQNTTGNFSTGFTPTFPPPSTTGDSNGQLLFGGTGPYTATDDLTANANVNSIYDNASGAVTIGAGTTSLVLTTNSAGVGASVFVAPGSSLLVGAVLAGGSSGTTTFVMNGGGTLTLQTTADTFAGQVLINAGTLSVNIGQSSTAGFVLNNGASLTTTQTLAAGNLIYVNSGTSSFASSNGTLTADFYGNGNLNWNTTSQQLNTNYAGTASMFANFGGTVNWGANNNGIRIISTTGNSTVWNPFTNFNMGSGTATIYPRNGTTVISIGGVQSTGTTAGLGGTATSGGHDVLWVVGSANIPSETLAGGIFNGTGTGAQPSSMIKTGTGSLVLTGISTALDTAGTAGAAYQTAATYSVFGGTLQLNYSVNPTLSLLPATTTFGIAQGGTLSLLGNSSSGSSSTQTFAGNGTTIGSGGGAIVMNANGASNTLTLNLAAITATAAGSVLNISTTGSGTDVVTTTNSLLADGTYGARITYGSGYATTTGGSPNPLSTYAPGSAFAGSGDSSSTNYLLTGSGSVGSADAVNSLTIASTTGNPQSLSLGANLTLTNGGLLYNGSDTYTISGAGSLASTATDLVIQQLGSGSLTISAPISSSGSGSLTRGGSGTLILAGVNTYTGQTYLDGGVTSISSDANLGAAATGATLNLEGGTLQVTTTMGLFNGAAGTNNRNVVLGGSGGTIDVVGGSTLTIAGVISDTNVGSSSLSTPAYGPLTKTDAGTLLLTGTNTYTGATFINGGTLSVNILANGNTVSSIGQSPSTANALTINGGSLQYTGGTQSTDRTFTVGVNGGTLDASGSGTLTFSNTAPVWYTASGNRTLTLTGSGFGVLAAAITDPSFVNSSLSGSTALVASGSGPWTLTNSSNSYSGGTTVSSGTLYVNNPSGSGTGTGTVNVNGGTLAGSGTISGAVNLVSNTKLIPGSIAAPYATLSTGTTSLADNATFVAKLNSDTNLNSVLAVSGVASFGTSLGALLSVTDVGTGTMSTIGKSYTIVTSNVPVQGTFANLSGGTVVASNGFTYGVTIDMNIAYGGDVTLMLQAIPEPGSLGLLALGGVSMLRRRRRAINSIASAGV